MKRTIELQFSDVSFGCDEYGFIPRLDRRRFKNSECYADAEDLHYTRHMRAKGFNARVIEGTLYVKQ